MRNIFNALQNLIYGDFRLTLNDKQLSRIKKF